MNKVERFQDSEIPYELLASFGLTQEMVEDLPMKVLEQLLSGQRTPLLPISIQDSEGKAGNYLARLSLVRVEDGIDVMLMPYKESTLLEEFEEQQQSILQNGNALYSEQDALYYQLDASTHQIMSMPSHVIEHNIQVLRKSIDMVSSDVEQLMHGEILCLSKENSPVTVGIDLTEDVGIRMVNGDRVAWEKEVAGEDLPLYSFGINGCWVNDGALSYVREEDYTQEMIDALEEKASQVRSNALHR